MKYTVNAAVASAHVIYSLRQGVNMLIYSGGVEQKDFGEDDDFQK